MEKYFGYLQRKEISLRSYFKANSTKTKNNKVRSYLALMLHRIKINQRIINKNFSQFSMKREE